MAVSVVIAILTYRRPEGLAAMLTSLCALEIPEGTSVRALVVDNDTTPSAKDMVATFSDDMPFRLDYVHTPEPGIPQARNRALEEAKTEAFLLFVDDDETITPNVLREHLRIQRETGATFVQGSCTKSVDDPNDSWWLNTTFFRDKEFPDGAPRDESWTNNVLIDMAFVRQNGVKFESALQFAGGSDTLFFQDVIRQGGIGAYAAHAIVEEVQPASRLTWRWALSRQYRYGVTRANTRLLRSSYFRALAYCGVRSVGMQIVGLATLCTVVVRGKRGLADGLALMTRGAGVAAGALGFRADEYRR